MNSVLRGIKAVYFDMDDTLCGYWDACKAGLRETFEECPIEGWNTDEMLRHWAAAFREYCPGLKHTAWYPHYLRDSGITRAELMRLALVRAGIQDTSLAEKLSLTYLVRRDKKLLLFPGAEQLLDALGAEYPLGLITNGPADLQRMEIATLNLAHRFQTILIEGELGFGKPDPRVFRLAEDAVGVAPGEILFVGNSYAHDIEPAMAAGWRTVWIRRPSDVPPSHDGVESTPEELPKGARPPDLTITELIELAP